MKKRTRSRELALQFLYMLDQRGLEFIDAAASWIESEEKDPQTASFALRLVPNFMYYGAFVPFAYFTQPKAA